MKQAKADFFRIIFYVERESVSRSVHVNIIKYLESLSNILYNAHICIYTTPVCELSHFSPV